MIFDVKTIDNDNLIFINIKLKGYYIKKYFIFKELSIYSDI